MKKLLSLATVAFLGLAGSAHASLLEVTLNSGGGVTSYGSSGASLNPTINLTSAIPSTLSLTGLAFLENTSASNEFTMPSGSLFGGNYLAVVATPGGPVPPGPAGTATFNLSGSMDNFGFTWGTIDTYNTLVLKDSRNVSYTITGTDILNHIIGSVSGTTQSDVNFFDPFGKIVSAKLTSSINAFEAGNFAQAETPLPASLPLMGAALLGLVVLAGARKGASLRA